MREINRDDVIKWGREAGFFSANSNGSGYFSLMGRHMLKFAELAYKAGVNEERSECAKVCEDRDTGERTREDIEAKECAAAIRARGSKAD